MKPFFNVKTSVEILEIIKTFPSLNEEKTALTEGLHRVLSREILSPEDLPQFPRATMDGFALRARDSFGASESVPVLLNLAGEIAMGQEVKEAVQPGQCFRIATGGMLPPGADAVAMVEHTQYLDDRTIELFRPLSPLDHVIQVGEDLQKGQPLLPSGRRLRSQDLGLLAGVGIETVAVFSRPRVAIISTGDEIVGIDEQPRPGFIRDINSYTLLAQVREAGALPLPLGRIKDQFKDLEARCRRGLEQADVLLISGGSSVGARDFTLEVIRSFPGAEVLAHGISISPGKPTILARVQNKIIWGLPGHVVSAMIVFALFVRPCLHHLEGQKKTGLSSVRSARLSRNVPSAQGREDYIRVSLESTPQGFLAVPIFGKSGILSTMVRADGIIRIDQHCEGLEKGESVDVILF
jgi:molybdopterin molybdotransferase